MTLHLPVISTMSIPVRLERSPISWPKASSVEDVTTRPFAVTGIHGEIEGFAAVAVCGRRYMPEGDAVKAVKPPVSKWRKKANPPLEATIERRIARIAAVLRKTPWVGSRDIREVTGMSGSITRDALLIGRKRGVFQAVQSSRGHFSYAMAEQ